MRQQYFTPYEVAQHNSPTDCWVSVFNKIYDLTPFLKARNARERITDELKYVLQTNSGSELKPIIENAGKDVTHWFDSTTHDVRSCICPHSGRRVPYCPQGRFLHVPTSYPCSKFNVEFQTPWWRDLRYQVGSLTQCARVVRFKNTLTGQDDKMEVPEEESVGEIRKRYLALNRHAQSYSVMGFVKDNNAEWILKTLDLEENLTKNGIPNKTKRLQSCSLAADTYTPVLMMYWKDELTTL